MIQRKMVGDLFFLHLKSEKSANFEHKRGVPENRQTENLGDFGVFQTFRMRTFQILRFAEKVVNPCNSTSKQGKKKAEWRVTIRRIDKKMVAGPGIEPGTRGFSVPCSTY